MDIVLLENTLLRYPLVWNLRSMADKVFDEVGFFVSSLMSFDTLNHAKVGHVAMQALEEQCIKTACIMVCMVFLCR